MAKGLRITDRDKGYSKLFAAVRAMRGTKLTVGVHEDQGGEGYEGGLTVAEVGAIHEFGAPDANVPRRSFLRGYFDEQQDDIADKLTRAGQAVLGRGMDPQAAYEAVGLAMAGDVQARISAGLDPPNAESTIRQKGSSKPLIGETGQLRASITAKVEVGG